MNRFDFSEMLNFKQMDLTPPDDVIRTIGEELYTATERNVRIGIEKYEGKIIDRQPTFATTISAMFRSVSGVSTAQGELGKQGEVTNQYEVFLYTPSYRDYRFRLMFVRFGIAHYPAEIVLEQGVANALSTSVHSDSVVIVNDKETLEKMVEEMLKTQYVLEVMQEFIRVRQLQEYRNRQAHTKALMEGKEQS